jgi:hypothetical protein
MNAHVSYWLTAAEPDQTHWSEVIRSLARLFNAPPPVQRTQTVFAFTNSRMPRIPSSRP